MSVTPGDLSKFLLETETLEESWEGISASSVTRFGLRVKDKEVHFPYFRYGGLTGFKVRRNTTEHSNRFYAKGDMNDVDLFGMHLCGNGDFLVVTEGEKDAISAWEMFPGDVVSIPTGATLNQKTGAGVIDKGVKAKENFLRKYKTIYLCLDQDQPGQAVAEAMAKWLGSFCHIVKFSEKDCNEMLKAGKSEEFLAAIEHSEPYRPTELISPADLRVEMLREVDPGQPYPWPSMNRLLGGMRPGVVTWGAGVKIGKTNSAMELTEHIVSDLGEKVGLFYLENSPLSTMNIVSGKLLGDMSAAARNRNWTEAEVDKAINALQNKVFLYNTRLGRDWSDIRPVIRWLAISEGVKYFFIDPLTALAPGDASKANAFLLDLYKDLTQMTMELDIHVNMYCHLNPPQSGIPHEEGGRVQAVQFTGSKAMIRYSSAVVGLERNVIAEDEEIKNRTTIKVLLARDIGTTTGEFYCYYNPDSGGFTEAPIIRQVQGGIAV